MFRVRLLCEVVVLLGCGGVSLLLWLVEIVVCLGQLVGLGDAILSGCVVGRGGVVVRQLV